MVQKLDIESELRRTVLITERGRKINGWVVTEKGYLLLLQQISTPKLPKTKAIVAMARLEFAQAFLLMQNMIKNPIQQVEHKKVDDSKFGDMVKSGLARTEEVRGYHRSSKNSELSKLLGERKRLANRLNGLFDDFVIGEIAELDRKIESLQTTELQKDLIGKEIKDSLISSTST